jgi:uncharacterized repeat protein (TIGR03803 family)
VSKLGFSTVVAVVFLLCASCLTNSPAQTLTSIYSFCPLSGCPDGSYPTAGLVQAADGSLYGTTFDGGTGDCVGGCGTVFKITSGGTLTALYSFTGGTDGANPYAGLIQSNDGNFYGTTVQAGSSGVGTIFRITVAGTLTTLYSFSGGTDGSNPYAGLIQATDGNFYGTTFNGGNGHFGTVFKITAGGALATLHSFTNTDGANPYAGLVQATDGSLYGTTPFGAHGWGTVFRITSNGALATLYSFTNGTDGANPFAGLIQATDGSFYGTTFAGGPSNAGTVFSITTGGRLSTLHSFDGIDGAAPYAVLVQAVDGNFYGTAWENGEYSSGTVFKITPSGALTTLHSFDGTDGSYPLAGMVRANDGSLYGTTYSGGANGFGTIFRLSGLASSTALVTSSPNPSQVGQLVTITATVGPAGPPMPTGTVSFTSNGAAISGCTSVPLGSSLTALCMTSTLAVGTDAIVATYSGDSNYSGSTGMLSQIVNPLP